MEEYEKLLLGLIDHVLEYCKIPTQFKGTITDYGEQAPRVRCEFQVQDGIGEETMIEYFSKDGSIINKTEGIDISHEGPDLETLNIEYDNCDYTYKQKRILSKVLEKSDDYGFFKDAFDWYSRENVFSRISELVRDGVIEWTETSREEWGEEELGDGRSADCITLEAEYGDVRFEYSYFEDRELVEEIRDEQDRESDPGDYYEFLWCIAPKLTIYAGEYYENNILDLTEEEEALLMGEEDDISAIDIQDILVRTSNARCYERDHVLDKINAHVNVINKKNYQKQVVEIPAYYCRTCNRYYILERDYDALKEMGIICCQVIELKDLKRDEYSYLAAKSLPMLYGYNVSKTSRLSEKERRLILDMIISNGIWSKARCIEFIGWLISKNCNRKNMASAIAKWNSDIDYLRGGNRYIPTDFKARKIFVS